MTGSCISGCDIRRATARGWKGTIQLRQLNNGTAPNRRSPLQTRAFASGIVHFTYAHKLQILKWELQAA